MMTLDWQACKLPIAAADFNAAALPCGVRVGFIETPPLRGRYNAIMDGVPAACLDRILSRGDDDYRLQSAACLDMLRALTGKPIEPRYTENGKPYDPDGKVFFSFSHAGPLAVCAAADFPVGTDAAPIVRYSRALAALLCREDELAALETAYDKNLLLTEFLTRKESRIKLSGGDLTMLHDDDPALNYGTFRLTDETLCTVCF